MTKYVRVVINTWDEIATYRFNFVMWRVRQMLQLLTIYFLWVTVTPSHGNLFGYSQPLILTYILGAALLTAIVIASRTQEIGDNIDSGNLSFFLTRPINYFGYWFARDIGDKIVNISFVLVELVVFYFLLKPSLFIQTDGILVLFTLLAVCLAVLLNFCIGSLFLEF